jgi:hypothetical protein
MSQQLNKRTMILLGLTLVAAAFLGLDYLSGGKKPGPSAKAQDPAVAARLAEAQAKLAATPSAPTAPVAAADPQPRLVPPPPADGPWGRDPFAIEAKRLPKGPKGADQFSGFRITGIVKSPQGYQALVNDHVVRPGDQVDGARVLRITSQGVELQKDAETRFIPLVEKEFWR